MSATNQFEARISKSKLWQGVLLIILIAALATGLFASLHNNDPDIAEFGAVLASCDLQAGPCSARFSDGSKVVLAFESLPVTGDRAFEVEVKLEDMDAESIQVDFRSLGMDMGLNRPHLMAIGHRRFQGEAKLSLCISGVMQWQATVIAETSHGLLAAQFPFSTVGPTSQESLRN